MPSGPSIRTRLLTSLGAALGQPEARLVLANSLAGRGEAIAAVRQIAAAARAGLSNAQTKLGLCYLHGNGVPRSETEARHWLDRAAQAGDAVALTELAKLALRGISGPYQRGPFQVPGTDLPAAPDRLLAAKLARGAADAGSAEARAMLAYIIDLDPSAEEGPEESEALYRESAREAWPLGQLGHAMRLLRDGSAEASREARDLLLAAAESGLPSAHFLLGALAEADCGDGLRRAVEHYRTAADLGHTGAKTRLGLALLTGRGTQRNAEEAVTWLLRAANGGDVSAAAMLGDFHANPEHPDSNAGEAVRWYRHAAERGHGGAARALARTIARGAAGRPDMRDIANWLQTAIELGEDGAWTDFGELLTSGSLADNDLPALHDWLQRMIQANRSEAGYYVGLCVNLGIGTLVDPHLARHYYLWAAANGVVEGMVAAGEMLVNGRGGEVDLHLARSLFEYAAQRGHAGAAYALGVIAGADLDSATTWFQRAAALGHAKARALVSEPAAA